MCNIERIIRYGFKNKPYPHCLQVVVHSDYEFNYFRDMLELDENNSYSSSYYTTEIYELREGVTKKQFINSYLRFHDMDMETFKRIHE